mmetsp:Transcript_5317/g.12257  ORF Transcript_5317/g.12257 Transcript_5317/m.12257 type:complete len:269 (+) Transcript_5317:852-1658(+)
MDPDAGPRRQPPAQRRRPPDSSTQPARSGARRRWHCHTRGAMARRRRTVAPLRQRDARVPRPRPHRPCVLLHDRPVWLLAPPSLRPLRKSERVQARGHRRLHDLAHPRGGSLGHAQDDLLHRPGPHLGCRRGHLATARRPARHAPRRRQGRGRRSERQPREAACSVRPCARRRRVGHSRGADAHLWTGEARRAVGARGDADFRHDALRRKCHVGVRSTPPRGQPAPQRRDAGECRVPHLRRARGEQRAEAAGRVGHQHERDTPRDDQP